MSLTYGDIIANAQADSDKVNDASVITAQWLAWCAMGIESLYKKLVPLDPDLWFNTFNFSLTGGASGSALSMATVDVARGVRAIHGVDLNPDTVARRTIHRRNFEERNIGNIGWWVPATFCDDRKYDLRGGSNSGTLVITPMEIAGGSYRLYYRQGPVLPATNEDLGNSTDEQFDPYIEYVSTFMARKALAREESDTSPCDQRLAEINQEIEEAYDRNDQEPSTIADVEENDGVWNRWW